MKIGDTYLKPHPFSQSAVSTDKIEEVLDLGQLARGLARKWWIIAGVATASTLAAGLKVLTAPPSYAALFEVLVQPGSAETDVIANIPETLTSGDRPSAVTTVDEDLLKILKSPKVLTPTVEQVQLRYPDLCAPLDSPTLPSPISQSSISSCYEAITNRLTITALDDALDEQSTIVQATFQAEDPTLVQFVLTQLSTAYLDYSLETKQADISRGIDFVEGKLPDLNTKVETLQTQLQDLRLDNNIIDPAARADQIANQVALFSQEQRELTVQLQQTRAIANDLRQQSQTNPIQTTSAALNENPRYQTLLGTLLELDAQIAEASTLYLSTAPEMQVLQEQRENLLSLLRTESTQSQREISSQIRQLEARNQALTQTLQGLNTETDQLTGVARTYDDIQRELTIATENLNQFITKREALEIDAAQREIPWELVTPPTTPKPVSSGLLRYLLLGGTLGLLLGIGLALLIDESSGILYSEADIKRTTRLPLLGSIPAHTPELETAPEQVSADARQADARQYAGVAAGSPTSSALGSPPNALPNGTPLNGRPPNGNYPYRPDPFLESFRTLHTNLRLLNTRQPLRSVAISSVMPGEGKSTVAIHLAEAAAATGQRVLLVDANLRHPQLHSYLDIPNTVGLTNLFAGDTNPAVIQKFSPDSTLYLLTAGSANADPSRLFSSPSMEQFINQIGLKFDLVIYDTPALLGQSDAYLVASQSDGLLLVTQPGKLKQSLLDRTMEQLQIADITLLGTVTRES